MTKSLCRRSIQIVWKLILFIIIHFPMLGTLVFSHWVPLIRPFRLTSSSYHHNTHISCQFLHLNHHTTMGKVGCGWLAAWCCVLERSRKKNNNNKQLGNLFGGWNCGSDFCFLVESMRVAICMCKTMSWKHSLVGIWGRLHFTTHFCGHWIEKMKLIISIWLLGIRRDW